MKGKRILSLLLSLLMLLSCLAGLDFSAYADTYSGTCGTNVSWSLDTSTGELTISGTGDMYNYTYSPDGTENNYRKIVKNVIIGDGVTSIGESAFERCENLTSVTIPNSVTSIDNYAFCHCENLISVTIPNSVTSISDGVFEECTSLTSVTIKNKDCDIYDTENTIDSGARIIGYAGSTAEKYAKKYGREFEEIEEACIHANTTVVGAQDATCTTAGYTGDTVCADCEETIAIGTEIMALGHNYVVKEVVPATCQSEGYTTYICRNCTESYVGEYVDTVEHNFGENEPVCTVCGKKNPDYRAILASGICGDNLTWVLYQDGELVISGTGDMYNYEKDYLLHELSPFVNNEAITSVVIEDGATSLGSWFLYGCSNITDISIPDTIITIGNGAFSGCTNVSEIIIPDSVTSIGVCAFQRCISLTSIAISENVTSIGYLAFAACKGLTTIDVDENNPNYISQNGVLFTKDETRLMQYPENKAGELYIVPRSVETIDLTAFALCDNLKAVILPIGLEVIEDEMFEECTNLERVVIPRTVTAINNMAFDGCISLTDIYYGGSESDKANIDIASYNSALDTATWHYNCCTTGTEHSFESILVEPTCTEQGYTTYTCSECGYQYVGDYQAERGHNCVVDKAVEATCTDSGLSEGSHCSVCSQVITKQEAVPMTGHKYSLVSNSATCQSAGELTYKCNNCDSTYTEPSEKTDHSYDSWKTTIYPTCSNFGLAVRSCQTCGITEQKQLDKANHNPQSVGAVAPTCQAVGYTEGEQCMVCGAIVSGREVIAKLSHSYVLDEAASRPATCTETGTGYYKCTMCGDFYTSVLSIKPHDYLIIQHKDSTPNERGYDVMSCKTCDNSYTDWLPYASDNSALVAAILMASLFDKADFSQASYDEFKAMYDSCKALADSNSSQEDIDNAIANIVTAMTSLVPYVDFNVFSKISEPTVEYEDATYTDTSYSILYGTPVTVTAPVVDGYIFDGWFDTKSKRILSMDSEYTFYISTNLTLEARYVPISSATITFANESGQVTSKVTKTLNEWSELDDIAVILPAVPYAYGKVNGTWSYDNTEVLAKLQAGENVTVTPVYDVEKEIEIDEVENESRFEPAGKLKFEYNKGRTKGTFIMSVNIPEECRVNSIGIAFYADSKHKFDPTQMLLTLNNKNMISQFNIDELDDVYIVNAVTDCRNWAAVGYITYFNQDGKLVTYYTNQVNVVDNEWIK